MFPRPALSRGLVPLRLAAALLGPVATGACVDDDAIRGEGPRPVVRAVTVESSPDVRETRYPGAVRARDEVDHAFRLAGRVDSRPVDVGSRVVKGQVLATLDPVDLDLEIAAAEAERASSRAEVHQTRTSLDRLRHLLARGAASRSAFDDAVLTAKEALGRLARAERELDLAANRRGYATLTAAFDGAVTAVSADAGEIVRVADPVVRVAATDRLEVEIAVPERALADLDHARATVSLWARPGETYGATLAEVEPGADPVTRTFKARFAVAGAAPSLLGMSATVALTRGDGPPVIRLPLSAVVDQGTGASVYVVDSRDGSLSLRPVGVARFGSADVLVDAGLDPGERVVTLGPHRLAPGLRVRVADAR